MRNIKLVIEYEGTNYHGWQIQPGLRTIQGMLESKLSMITKADTEVIGAGRTDAGVHASGQVANFKTGSRMTPEEFKSALNSVLPKDVVIKEAEEVDNNFHARFDAISRTYEYTVLNSRTPSAFLRNYTYLVPQPLDVPTMASACDVLLGTHDFSSFASIGDTVRNPMRTVLEAGCWVEDASARFPLIQAGSGAIIRFRISANAFLRGMVRSIVGTLLEIGKGKMSAQMLQGILDAKDRSSAGPCLPARGLCLVKVDYG